MFDDNNDEILDDYCPRCRIGRIQLRTKPFLSLFHKHLFTIPDAVCYICDICDYYEFDVSNYEIISDMLDAAKPVRHDTIRTQALLPRPPEDDLPNQTESPLIN
jgi:hypothetical protein